VTHLSESSIIQLECCKNFNDAVLTRSPKQQPTRQAILLYDG
jgi:hypothetical protein